MTKLGELTLRLQKLYSKKFGHRDIVHIIKESGKVSCDVACGNGQLVASTALAQWYSAGGDDSKSEMGRERERESAFGG